MTTFHAQLELETKGNCDMIDITKLVEAQIERSGLKSGLCTVFCPGSTGAVTTIEYEEGLIKDFSVAMERVAPESARYEHHLRWGDGNGHSHVRASLLGPSLTVPFVNGRLTLGIWQQMVFIDFDNRQRSRKLEVLVLGE
jgi:secondary thiamine-phosphate synthase enzyme